MYRDKGSWSVPTVIALGNLLWWFQVIPTINFLRWLFGNNQYTLGEIFGQWLVIVVFIIAAYVVLAVVLVGSELGWKALSNQCRRLHLWLVRRYFT